MEENEISHSWPEYRMLILSELKSLNENINRLTGKIDSIDKNHNEALSKIDNRVVILETKAGFLGAFGGLVSFGAVEFIKYIVNVGK